VAVVALPSGGVLHAGGTPGGAAILFLHGVGGGAWSWGPQREALAASARTFVWEARGHGAAAPVDDAGLSDYYADAQEGLAAAVRETGRPLVVAGHSMGGLLAIALACDRHADVAALFLIDPVYSDGSSEAYGHFAPAVGPIARWLCGPLLRSFEHDGKMSRAVARWVFERAFQDRSRMETAWEDQRLQIPFEYPRMLRESFDRPVGFELRDFASEIGVPTTLLEGGRPGAAPRFPLLTKALSERLGTRFTHETIPGGHYLQLDRPAEVTQRLAAFVETVALAGC